MFKYYLNRGLDAVEILAQNFPNHIWWLPDLICPEVIDTVHRYVGRLEFYHINDKLKWEVIITGNDPKVFYVVDFFGKETVLGREAPPNTLVIRDSVWFPYPFSPVEYNQIWFNSLRKIFRGAKGCSLVSPFRISGYNEVPNLFCHHTLGWEEMKVRYDNYYFCKEIFSEYAIPDHNQEFPSVFPIRLKHRDKILSELGTPLPGMWVDKYKLGNELYNELTFIPVDSRFDRQKLADLAVKVMELNK